MNTIWSGSIDDYLEACDLAKSRGKQPGDSMEAEFIEIMQKKGIKPIGHTELNKEELIQEASSKKQSIFQMEVDNQGKSTYKFIKPEEEKSDE